LSRRTAKREDRARRNLAAGSTPAADTGVEAALDRLLDPLEELSQEELRSETVEAAPSEAAAASSREELQSETVEAAQREAAAASSQAPPSQSSGRLGGPADLGKRPRPRYEQKWETALWCFLLIAAWAAVLWLAFQAFLPI
jgi:hypothetical protein